MSSLPVGRLVPLLPRRHSMTQRVVLESMGFTRDKKFLFFCLVGNSPLCHLQFLQLCCLATVETLSQLKTPAEQFFLRRLISVLKKRFFHKKVRFKNGRDDPSRVRSFSRLFLGPGTCLFCLHVCFFALAKGNEEFQPPPHPTPKKNCPRKEDFSINTP